MQASQQRAVGLHNGPEAPPPPPPPLPPPSTGFQLPAKAALPRDEPGPAPPLPPPFETPPPAVPQPPWGAPASQVWALPGAGAPAAAERMGVEPAKMRQRALAHDGALVLLYQHVCRVLVRSACLHTKSSMVICACPQTGSIGVGPPADAPPPLPPALEEMAEGSSQRVPSHTPAPQHQQVWATTQISNSGVGYV